jgi:hypothetical protein
MKNEIKRETKKRIRGKKYTPPSLTVYGKLTEITAGGSGEVTEADAGNNSKNNRA